MTSLETCFGWLSGGTDGQYHSDRPGTSPSSNIQAGALTS
uniref:Uncharacterized protein n=1 Tax=Physcomitrium patens TaxID=3218 RepID=A0A2K1IBN6_PHYPA|nr:hypothetical protein PHYPA_030160 [Physcomitrium patens]